MQKRVLIVDDDADLRDVLRLWFEESGFEVTLSSNGEQAMQILRGCSPPDLILTDFMMPELNGIELVRLLKEHLVLSDVPVVVMSNNATPEFRKQAQDFGARAYLLKPEGARAIVEKAIRIVFGDAPASVPAPAAATASVQAMRESLLALVRVTRTMPGLPVEAASAMIAAEKLIENLFAAAPISGS